MNDANSELYRRAHERFHDMMLGNLTDDGTPDLRAARNGGLLEAAAVIEAMRARADETDTPQEVISLLSVLYLQVIELVEEPQK